MQSDSSDVKLKLNKWILETFKSKNFKKIDPIFGGTSEKGDGYVGDIAFIKVRVETFENETEEFDLVIKYGKQSKSLREKMPIRQAFLREIFVYNKIVPLFKQFTENKIDDFIAKCFGTLVYEDQEVILLQNLKSLGYDIHDRFKPLDINHLKLTLSNYGKWHALSLAYQDQYPENFDKVFKDKEDIMDLFKTIFEDSMEEIQKGVYLILEANDELEVLQKIKEKFKNGFLGCFQELKKKRELAKPLVYIHGDPWNNNFMFKYEGLDKSNPISAIFLDFQLSKLASPILDLAYHIYATASDKEFQRIEELLQTYHLSLSDHLMSLGSDPDRLFPYSQLESQWKIYSPYGAIMAGFVLPFALSNTEEVVDIHDIDGSMIGSLYKKMGTKGLLAQRIISVFKNYIDFNQY